MRGEHYLAWRRGEGAVRLLGRDGHSMLLEYAGETLLQQVLDEQGDNAATAIATDVMAKLFSPWKDPFPPELSRSGTFFKPVQESATDRDAGRQSYVEAALIADRLLADPRYQAPNDLHHDNILHGPRGWLAIPRAFSAIPPTPRTCSTTRSTGTSFASIRASPYSRSLQNAQPDRHS